MRKLGRLSTAATLLAALTLCSVTAQAQLLDRLRQERSDAQRADPGDRDRERDEQRGRADDPRGEITPQLLPPGRDRDSRWFLGVEVEYRDYGAQITRVVRSSPASRAGLEARDVIVTVGGYQIGRLGGRLYTLDRELELRADRRGNVSLLVYNHRNGQLTPLPVQLDAAEQRPDPIDARPLRGTVSTRRGVSLARNAMLSVNLLDVTDRRRNVVVRQRSYRNLGPLPLPFELVYTPSDILPDHKYALSAEVTVNGLATHRSLDRYEVFQRENQGAVNMVLVPVRQ